MSLLLLVARMWILHGAGRAAGLFTSLTLQGLIEDESLTKAESEIYFGCSTKFLALLHTVSAFNFVNKHGTRL